jgi:DNA repair protein RadA/Sms
MPRLSEIESEEYSYLPLPNIPWFPEAANQKGLIQGGIYLLSGPPGAGKTTIALQMGVDAACTGQRVLYLALEQSPSDIKSKIETQVFPNRRAKQNSGTNSHRGEPLPFKEGLKKTKEIIDQEGKLESDEERVERYFWIDPSVSSMEALPDFLARQVLPGLGQYFGTRLLVVDSIQGLGTAPTSSKPYQELYKFNRWAKESHITVLLIGHITKGGAIAGPRSLEHNVDCVLYLRKAMRLRPMFVPKNRFGPERYEPLSLEMDQWGCLEKSKHVKPQASLAYGYLPRLQDFIEVQALVKLPKYGDKPGIKAPYLPRQKLTQLVGIVSSVRDIDISDLTFEINCSIPGGHLYDFTLDLPLAMSMLSSYFQCAIPFGSLFAGEVDLFRKVRPVTAGMCQELARVISDSQLGSHVARVFVSDEARDELRLALENVDRKVDVIGVSDLDHLVAAVWPDIVEE